MKALGWILIIMGGIYPALLLANAIDCVVGGNPPDVSLVAIGISIVLVGTGTALQQRKPKDFRICHSCNAANPTSYRFCGKCGAKLS